MAPPPPASPTSSPCWPPRSWPGARSRPRPPGPAGRRSSRSPSRSSGRSRSTSSTPAGPTPSRRSGVKARVTGYLIRVPFKEGAEVKKGDLLFEIDPRPYQAQLDQAEAPGRALRGPARAGPGHLRPGQQTLTGPAAVSQQELDQDEAAVDEAEARVKAAKASRRGLQAQPRIHQGHSPIDGQVSRYYLTLGNLVNQDQTLLTTVVSLDPMYAYFDMDEPTLLRIRRAINAGQDQAAPQDGDDLPVLMGLQGEDGLPARGDGQLRQQPGQPDHRQHRRPRRLPQPQAGERRAGCCRRACSSASACRSASRTRRCWSSTGPSGPTRG